MCTTYKKNAQRNITKNCLYMPIFGLGGLWFSLSRFVFVVGILLYRLKCPNCLWSLVAILT